MHGDEDVPLDYYTAEEPKHGNAQKTAKRLRASSDNTSGVVKPSKQKSNKSGERFDFWEKGPKVVVSHLCKLHRKYNPSSSSLEDQAVLSTISTITFDTTNDIVNHVAPKTKPLGCSVLILCSSALECIAVIKEVNHKIKGLKTAKCFARHLKINEQLDLLRKGAHPVAVGTPGRVLSILNAEPSVFRHVTKIIIDVKRDVKLRSIFDIPETAQPLLETLMECMTKLDKPLVFFLSRP